MLTQQTQKSNTLIGVIIFYPFLVFSILGNFLIPIFLTYLKEVIAFGLLSLMCFGVVFVVKNCKIKIYLIWFIYILLSLFVLIKISFYYQYGVRISASAFYVIFETNATEVSDFVTSYLSFTVFGVFLLLFIPYLFFYRLTKVFGDLSSKNASIKIKIIVLIIVVLSGYVINWKFKEENFLLTSLTSYKEYKQTKKLIKENLAQTFSKFVDVTSFKKEPQTYVVIIGESTSREHLQLYAYTKETNPLLSEIKGNLIIFDSVITPHVHTIRALDKILTLSEHNSPNTNENISIVQLANQAGFSTYWISNQRPVGMHESIPTLIGSAAKKKYFLATDDYTDISYDEKILPILDSVLQKKETKKLIFIHLIGTHITYSKRYPKKYSYFNKNSYKNLLYTHPKALKTIVEYDNAIRYNDFIVRGIIEKVKKEDLFSYVLYLSDHGDEVYDEEDFFGHNEYLATKAMYEVPFIAWFSKKFKNKNQNLFKQSFLSHRKYSLEHFIHSFADISKITFKGLDSTKSIFNPAFKKRTRWIKQNIDYDSKN